MQKEFKKLFFFNKIAPLDFTCNDGKSFFDIGVIFLSGYLHDAEFFWSKKYLTSKVLKINIIARDRWEIRDCPWAKSILTISPVLSAELEIIESDLFDGDKPKWRKHMINQIYLSEDYWYQPSMDIAHSIPLYYPNDNLDEYSFFTLNIFTRSYILKLKLPGYDHSMFPCEITLKDIEGPFKYQ